MKKKRSLIVIVQASIVCAVGVMALAYSPALFGRIALSLLSHHLNGNPVGLLLRVVIALMIILGGPVAVWWFGAQIGLRLVSRVSRRFESCEVAK